MGATITSGPKALFLQVGNGSYSGTYQSGGTPLNNSTVNTVSVAVPANVVGSGVAQPDDEQQYAVGELLCTASSCAIRQARSYVGGWVRTPNGTGSGVLSVTSPASLTSVHDGDHPIHADQLDQFRQWRRHARYSCRNVQWRYVGFAHYRGEHLGRKLPHVLLREQFSRERGHLHGPGHLYAGVAMTVVQSRRRNCCGSPMGRCGNERGGRINANWLGAPHLVCLALLVLVVCESAFAATYVVDDSSTIPFESQVVTRWRTAAGTSRQLSSEIEGGATVSIRLNLQPWLNRNGRVYLALPQQPVGVVNVEWATQGRLLPGKLQSGGTYARLRRARSVRRSSKTISVCGSVPTGVGSPPRNDCNFISKSMWTDPMRARSIFC